MNSIRFEEVGHQFGERVVLSGVSADLREARVGIIGSNGSGKSTLARMINGLVHHLSSGQKQLFAMASILVTEPSILVCDEPTTLLDMRNTRRLAELLSGLSQQIILVTHDLDLIVGFERVLVIADGRLVADGHGAESVAYYRKLMS